MRVMDPAPGELRPAARRALEATMSKHTHEERRLELAAHARAHRFAPTPSEARLWEALGTGKLGVGFRRQVVIGRYIVDFASAEARVVVEVDGGYHRGRRGADARRDEALRRAGWRVVRVSAEEVMRDVGEVAGRIAVRMEEWR